MQNTLFNFIKSHISVAESIGFEGSRLVSAEDRNLNSYFRFELDNQQPVVVSEYCLHDHHISVYETDTSYKQSQYHYTGHFVDANGILYQLHVYFNENDEITSPPVFSRQETNGQFTLVAAESYHEQFVSLARFSGEKITKALRKQHTLKTQELEANYLRLEDEASKLSENIERDYESYILKLDEICYVLQQIIPLVKHQQYQKTDDFIRQTKAFFVEQHNVAVEHQGEPLLVGELSTTITLSEDTDPASPPFIQIPQSISLDLSINDLVLRFLN